MNILLQIIIGFFLADIITGGFHWFEDSYLHYCINIPIFSEISKDNELHHYFPRAMLAYKYTDHMLYSIPLTFLVVLLVYFFNKKFVLNNPYLIITFLIFSSISNVIHRFSHMRDCENNAIVKFMQKIGIFAHHDYHSKHHQIPDARYCVISVYSNSILDTLGFWRGLEGIIYLLTGVSPDRKGGYSSYESIHTNIHSNAKLECPDEPTLEDVRILKEKLHGYIQCELR